MIAADASKRIRQMVAFVQQEAREKAEEIQVKAESEFMARKLNLQTEASVQIRQEVEKKRKDRLGQKKIARSQRVSAMRFSVMKGREAKLKDLQTHALTQLATVQDNAQYPELIRLLLVESLLAIAAERVIVQCRECDQRVVRAQMEPALKHYSHLVLKETGVKVTCDMALDEKEWLPPPPTDGFKGLTCSGGVVVATPNRKIIVRNTLDSRLAIAFEELKPQIGSLLFGKGPDATTNGGTQGKVV